MKCHPYSEFKVLSRRMFGPFSRYCLDHCRDRFGAEVYLVLDAEQPDEYGLSRIIRQSPTEVEALHGLDT